MSASKLSTRTEDKSESKLPSLERLVTLVALLLGRLAIEIGDGAVKKKGRRAKKNGIEEIEQRRQKGEK